MHALIPGHEQIRAVQSSILLLRSIQLILLPQYQDRTSVREQSQVLLTHKDGGAPRQRTLGIRSLPPDRQQVLLLNLLLDPDQFPGNLNSLPMWSHESSMHLDFHYIVLAPATNC